MGFFSRLRAVIAQLRPMRRRRKPRLGIAFGSGGAKGMAHLGALKAFEEAGIRFDVVTGTSIGAIVGALYAKGFTSADMVHIVENLNRREFSKNLRPYADLSFAREYLKNYVDGEVSSLPLPFAAWATDAETNEGVLLDSGDLTSALVASSAIPPFFRSVEREGRKLYDGAFTNAVPSDICRDLGADFVIGIDLAAFRVPEEEQGMVRRLFGAAVQKITPVRRTADCISRGYAAADIVLRPRLGEYRATDISSAAMKKMFELGYDEASARIGEIRAAIAAREKK